jgi:hypothetical protein
MIVMYCMLAVIAFQLVVGLIVTLCIRKWGVYGDG